jgi:hypothetical protein
VTTDGSFLASPKEVAPRCLVSSRSPQYAAWHGTFVSLVLLRKQLARFWRPPACRAGQYPGEQSRSDSPSSLKSGARGSIDRDDRAGKQSA